MNSLTVNPVLKFNRSKFGINSFEVNSISPNTDDDTTVLINIDEFGL